MVESPGEATQTGTSSSWQVASSDGLAAPTLRAVSSAYLPIR